METIPEDERVECSKTRLQFVTSVPRLNDEANSLLAKAKLKLYEQFKTFKSKDSELKMKECLDSFFNEALPLAVQERETKYVNTMSEVFRDEMKERNEALNRFKQKCAVLEKRLAESDGAMDNLRSNLDRRVYEMDTMRKMHYKEILMLRELVTRQKTDPYTLRALDEAIAELHSNRKKIMLSVESAATQQDANSSEAPQTDERVELLKNELEKRKQFIHVLRQDREKWEERAHDAITQLEALKKENAQRRESQIRQQPSYMSAWWFGGVESGTRERITIEAAIDSNVTSVENVATAAIEVLAIPSVWATINARLTDHELESEGAQKLQKSFLDLNPRPAEVVVENVLPVNEAPSPLPRSTSQIPCIHCNGLGIIDPTAITQDTNTADQQLQKTLQRVQELKTEIEKHVSEKTKLQTEKDEALSSQRALLFKGIDILAERDKQIMELTSKSEHDASESEANITFTTIAVQTDIYIAESPKTIKDTSRVETLESQIQEKDILIEKIQIESFTKDEKIQTLQDSVDTAEDKLLKIRRASDTSQQLLRQEISVLNDTITMLREASTVTMREKQAALTSYLAKIATLGMIPTTKASIDADIDITKLIPWSDDESQAELLVRVTEEAALNAEKEWSELTLTLEAEAKEDASTPEITRDAVQSNWFETILGLQAENEMYRQNSRKISAVQMQRIVTLSSHLARLSAEMLGIRKKLMAQVTYWKTECEKMDYEQQCLVTEFNCYKTNYLVQKEVLKIQALNNNDDTESQWSTIDDDIQEFMKSIVANFPPAIGSLRQCFVDLSTLVLAADKESKQSNFEALKMIVGKLKDITTEENSDIKHRKKSTRKSHSRPNKSFSTVVVQTASSIRNLKLHENTTNAHENVHSKVEASPIPSSPILTFGEPEPPTTIVQCPEERQSPCIDSIPDSCVMVDDTISAPSGPTILAISIAPQRPSMRSISENEPSDSSAIEIKSIPNEIHLPVKSCISQPTGKDNPQSLDTQREAIFTDPALDTISFSQVVCENSSDNQVEHEDYVKPKVVLDIPSLAPLNSSNQLQQRDAPVDHVITTTTEIQHVQIKAPTPPSMLPAFDIPTQKVKPQVECDGIEMNKFDEGIDTKDGFHHLKKLAHSRKDIIAMLAVINWDAIIAVTTLRRYKDRYAEANLHRSSHCHSKSKQLLLLNTLQEVIQAREQQLHRIREHQSRIRYQLGATNQMILNLLSKMFSQSATDEHSSLRRSYYTAGQQIDMSLVDMNAIPLSQRIPTSHYPRQTNSPEKRLTGGAMQELDIPQGFPNRSLKFRYDLESRDFSLIHVAKRIHPRSAGPLGRTNLSVLSPNASSASTPQGFSNTPQKSLKTDSPRHANPYRPKSTPSYLSRYSNRRAKPAIPPPIISAAPVWK